jgi:hypothetical protein
LVARDDDRRLQRRNLIDRLLPVLALNMSTPEKRRQAQALAR